MTTASRCTTPVLAMATPSTRATWILPAPGWKTFAAHEDMGSSGNRGATFRDSRTGKAIWSIPAAKDTGRAAAADNDSRHAGALRIYTTTAGTELRLRTLMHDPVYRLSVARENISYNQPPHPGFHIWEGMELPAQPHIVYTTADQHR